jgi:hypothetical protein
MLTALMLAAALGGCVGGSGGMTPGLTSPAPVANVVGLTVDAGPAAAPGQLNHAYVSVQVCPPGSSSCATIDHVRLDTGSTGLRLVRSVLVAHQLTLTAETDAASNTVEECMRFAGGQTFGPVALADVHLAGEVAPKIPVQIMDDTQSGAPAPASCGANGTLINGVTGFGANGVLGVGLAVTDCGASCTSATYYGCNAAGTCTAEDLAVGSQVVNPVVHFATDNNGVVVELPALVNANGDASVQGELIFGIATQSDNQLPVSGLTVLGADTSGQFLTTYNGAQMPGIIDSGTDSYTFTDASIATCTAGAFIGYYCPAVAPQSASATNTGIGTYNGTDTVAFAIADPNTFVQGAAAFIDLAGGGGSTRFIWGMPFFYGRVVYFGFAEHMANGFTGPFYAY